jgi:hypothetical protein
VENGAEKPLGQHDVSSPSDPGCPRPSDYCQAPYRFSDHRAATRFDVKYGQQSLPIRTLQECEPPREHARARPFSRRENGGALAIQTTRENPSEGEGFSGVFESTSAPFTKWLYLTSKQQQ